MILDQNTKLVMIGDSITDCNRQRPVGEGLFDALGNGYVNLVNARLKVDYPEKNIRVVNMGISGNTIRDLKNRWENDVIALKPDVVSMMIGINDVWRHFDSRQMNEIQVGLGEYEETLDYLIEKTLAHVNQMILLSPFFIEPNPDEPMRKMMDSYRMVVKKKAEKYQLPYVDIQEAFNHALKYYHPAEFSWDRVHPNTAGHYLIAKTFLECLKAK